MNKFEWDLNFLLSKEKELLEKIEELEQSSSKDIKQIDLYKEVLDTYQNLISNFNIKLFNSRDDDTSIDYDEDDVLSIQEFKEEILPYTNFEELTLLLYSMDVLRNYLDNFTPVCLSPFYHNNKELVDYTIELIKQVPHKDFVNKFIELCDPNKRILHIKHENKIPLCYYGLTLVDTYSHIPYGIISRKNSIQDIITTGHELFHMIIRENEEPFYIQTSKTIYSEVEGFFANLLFSDLLKQKGFSQKEIDFLDNYDLFKCKYIINDSFITTFALTKFENNNKINFEELNKYLNEYGIFSKVNKANFLGYLNYDFVEHTNYAFSYLVALDLYNLYKQDPEKVINHLYKIPSLEGKHVEKDLESIDVTFFEDGYINLDNHCKKLLKKKTTL